MTPSPNEIEQAVARTLRDNLEKLQRTTDELNQAVSDLVSACASARPANSLPPMLRAQTAAASLSASFEVLSRFVTAALQPAFRSPAEHEAIDALESSAPAISEPMMQTQPVETVAELQASDMVEEGAPAATAGLPSLSDASADFMPSPPAISDAMMQTQPAESAAELRASDMIEEGAPASTVVEEELPPASAEVGFDVSSLLPEERELHRRANRVAKVAMQDIKMLRPEDVRLGKEHKDLCTRLRDDIEKAHKEYDRRFHSIFGHPVDYFYDRMVEILGDGDPEALGEYPYPSPVLRH